MNNLPLRTFLAVSCSIPLLSISSAAQSDKQPNVVVIFADDLGYGDLGCYGATKLKTPNIDQLARQGRRFTDAHAASAVCTPSRYALLTGEYPFRKELWLPVFLKSGLIIDTGQLTVASLMKRAGYATACIGKWHLGFGNRTPDWNGELKPGPLELGFDYYFGVPVVNSHPPFVYVENHRVVGLVPEDPLVYDTKAKTRVFREKMGVGLIGGGKAAHALYDDSMVGTHLVGKAVQWIKDRKDQPFFLYLATTNIHHPFTPHPRFKGSSECGMYGDFVHELDWIVGQVTKTLDELDLADNTLVIFTSDNGGMLNIGGQEAHQAGHRKNGELLGFKFDAWEGGHRVPFVARWPGRIEAGSTSDQLISNIDLMATMAALTDQKLKDGEGPDSINALPTLTSNPSEPARTELVLGPRRKSHLALRSGDWIYIGAQGGGGFSSRVPGTHMLGGPAALKFAGQHNSDVEDGKIKKGAPREQLYNLASDVSQRKNVIREHPQQARKMRERLNKIRAPAAPPPFAPLGRLRFDFEGHDAQGWRVVEGAFAQPISSAPSLPRWQRD
ncbi:MAG: arylsulfatase, partial [Planctomycetota bacterium]|nr:arylsulfatase [Planctomycetota bacterium]